jgi:hypothetical protein
MVQRPSRESSRYLGAITILVLHRTGKFTILFTEAWRGLYWVIWIPFTWSNTVVLTSNLNTILPCTPKPHNTYFQFRFLIEILYVRLLSIPRVQNISLTSFPKTFILYIPSVKWASIAQSGYALNDRGVGVRVQVRWRIFTPPCGPDWPWVPTNFLSNGHGGGGLTFK